MTKIWEDRLKEIDFVKGEYFNMIDKTILEKELFIYKLIEDFCYIGTNNKLWINCIVSSVDRTRIIILIFEASRNIDSEGFLRDFGYKYYVTEDAFNGMIEIKLQK